MKNIVATLIILHNIKSLFHACELPSSRRRRTPSLRATARQSTPSVFVITVFTTRSVRNHYIDSVTVGGVGASSSRRTVFIIGYTLTL